MRRMLLLVLLALALQACGTSTWSLLPTVAPLSGQSPNQQEKDREECYNLAQETPEAALLFLSPFFGFTVQAAVLREYRKCMDQRGYRVAEQ